MKAKLRKTKQARTKNAAVHIQLSEELRDIICRTQLDEDAEQKLVKQAFQAYKQQASVLRVPQEKL